MILAVSLIAMGMFVKVGSVQPVSLNRLTRPTIVIDAGHGGEDGGAVGVDGIVEKNINLSIAQKLRDLLVLQGYDVIMTRDSDTAIYDAGTEGLRNKKISDLDNRLKLMQENPGCIFLSIHQNQFGSPIYHGAQVFYSTNSQSSQDLAQVLQDSFRTLLDPENNRKIKPVGEEIFLLNQAPTTAVLVECGFLSNQQEAYRLTDEAYQSEIAFVLFTALENYIHLGV